MVQVNKIDSNITGLAYAEEAELGLLIGETRRDGTVVPGSTGDIAWTRLGPNSYNDFGGELVTVAPNPINPSRQRQKGIVTDLNAAGGFNHDVTFYNLQDLLQGVMFADIRRKERDTVTSVSGASYTVSGTGTDFNVGDIVFGVGFSNSQNNGASVVTASGASTVSVSGLTSEASPPAGAEIIRVGVQGAAGDLDVDISGDFATITSTSLDFTTLELVPGQWIYVGGDAAGEQFSNTANNGFKRIRSISANALVLDKSVLTMVTEASTTETVQIFFGDVLKNELGTLIKRRSYNLERLLGAPDDSAPAALQSEVIAGAVANEFTLNVPTANLVNSDFTFVATDNQQRAATSATPAGPGPKQTALGSISDPIVADVWNTSSDFSRLKMSVVSDTDEAPTALFAFITEATITINNNVSPNKAVSVLGSFDVTAGTFQVSGSVTAYFSNINAVQAVRNNSDVTIDMAIVKDNQGYVLDLPLIALGDGRLNVEQDQPITLPLSMDAATAASISSDFDYTAMFTFFNYLPNSAG